MPKHIQFYFNLEFLNAYSTSGRKAFGLNLVSVSLSPNDAADPWTSDEIEAIARKYFRPWKATRLDSVSTWIEGDPTAGTARTEKFRWRGRDVVESVNGFPTSFGQLSSALDSNLEERIPPASTGAAEKFQKLLACFALNPANRNLTVSTETKPWGVTLGNTSVLPAPIPQLLNLAHVVKVNTPPGPGVKSIAIVPTLDFGDVIYTPQPAGPSGGVWDYVASVPSGTTPTGPTPAAKAYFSNFVRIEPERDALFLDLNTLLVKKPASPSILDENWRTSLENKMAEIFDLPLRIKECLSGKLATPGSINQDTLERYHRLYIASLADDCRLGLYPMANKQVFANSLLRKKPAADKSILQISDALRTEITGRLRTHFPDVNTWIKFLKDTLPDLRGPLERPVRFDTVLKDMDLIYSTVLLSANLALLFVELWRKISEGSATPELKAIATKLSEFDKSVLEQEFDLKRLFAKENIGVFWRHMISTELVDSDGKILIAESLKRFLSAYFRLRFGQQFQDPSLPNLSVEYNAIYSGPNVVADTATPILTDFEAYVGRFIEQEKTDLLPGKIASPGPPTGPPEQVPATEIPQSISFAVDKVASDGPNDLLEKISGIGLLMRPAGRTWRCHNMASALVKVGDSYQPLFSEFGALSEPVLVPSRINYINGLRNGFLTYDNHPLSATSPAAGMTRYRLESDVEENHRPLIRFASSNHPRAKLTPLVYGQTYEALPFIVSNAGSLPKILTNAAAGEGDLAPFDIEPLSASSVPSGAPVRTFRYPRTVRIGGIRLSNFEGKQFIVPPIPDNTFPRVRDMSLDSGGRILTPAAAPVPGSSENLKLADEDKAQDVPLILLASAKPPFDRNKVSETFDFCLRLPAVDINTWDRWVMSKKVGGVSRSADEIVSLRHSVWAAFHYLSECNRKNEANRVQTRYDLTIDDPSLPRSFVLELRSIPGGNVIGSTTITLDQPAIPTVPTAANFAAEPILSSLLIMESVQTRKYDRDNVDTAQFKESISVRCKVAASDESDGFDPWSYNAVQKQGSLTVRLKPGSCYKLTISCKLPRSDYIGNTAKFANIYDFKSSDILGTDYRVSSTDLFFEVAAPPDTLNPKLLHTWLTPTFSSDQDSDRIRVKFNENGAEKKFSWAGRAELDRQMWRWQGRNTPLHPCIKLANPNQDDAAPPDEIANWEIREYGTREDNDHSIVSMQFEKDANGNRSFSYEEVLRSPIANQTGPAVYSKNDLRSLHYRFRAKVYHRYEGLLLKDAVFATDSWKSKFIPCRLDRDPQNKTIQPPKVRFIFPLTQSFDPSTTKNSAGLLVVLSEPWFTIGGIGEILGCEVVFSQSGLAEGGKYKYYFEIGHDPIFSGATIARLQLLGSEDPNNPSGSVTFDPELICGPIGHTFDTEGNDPLFTSTSFMIPAPTFKGTDGVNRELEGWGMAEIRFKRIIRVSGASDPSTEKRLESGWTSPYWVQFLPETFVKRDPIIDPGTSKFTYESSDRTIVIMNGQTKVKLVDPGEGNNQLDYYLLLMRDVFDANGRFGQVAYVNMFYQTDDPAVWRTSETSELAGISKETKLRAEIIQVQRRRSKGVSLPKITSSATLWRLLFEKKNEDGTLIRDADRARIVAISPRISNTDIKKCDEGDQ